MINFSLPRTASDIYFISYISELIQGVRSQLGVNNTKLPYNTWASAQARSLSHSTTRAPSLLHSQPAGCYGNAESPNGCW